MRASILVLAVPFFIACSSGGADGSAGSTGTSGTTGLAPPAVGMQLKTTAYHLDPGQETYQCWSFVTPTDAPISLVGLQNQVPTAGLHHWAVFTNGEPYKEAGPYECSTMGATWGLISGGGLSTPDVEFPAGTAMNVNAGQHVIFQLHMLNASTEARELPPAYMNLVGTTEKNMQAVGLLIGGTLNIDIPAHAMNVQTTGSCTLTQPLEHIFDVFPHMHQLGKRITSQVMPAGSTTPVMVNDQTWNFSDQGLYQVASSAAVGDQVSVSCYYDNPSANDVSFGLSTNAEMCVEVLYYYPATVPSFYCGLE